MQTMIWFAGNQRTDNILKYKGLRGAVAFALALNVRTHHRSQVITTTLFLVLFTTLVLGSSTSLLLRKLGLQRVQDEPEVLMLSLDEELHENLIPQSTKPVKVSWIHRIWRNFDEKFMKPVFGGRARGGI
jgi:NhaP-type Na+/H+ and K+/H+ antiporter